jgi:predicted NAD/FAD-dependent oxidoreductase
MDTETLVVGAGIAGLTCARQLVEVGKNVVLLEKSRGVGGRCATRRVDDTVVDHGLTFYHGSDPELRAALEITGGDAVIRGWPRRVLGTGPPCQPSAFRPADWRLAYTGGVNTFPRQLAADLDVRLNCRVDLIESVADRWRVVDEAGREYTTGSLVLTLPTPQAMRLLEAELGASRELESARALLREIGFVASLTVIAFYQARGQLPDWDMWYPEDSSILQLVSHDSSKRQRTNRIALVLQALPAWSREQLERPEVEWSAAMIEDVGRLAGSWAAEPEMIQTHRWRFARIGSGGDLTGPMTVALPDGRRLGLAGDGFAPGGGVQAAWRSGRELARRLVEEQAT